MPFRTPLCDLLGIDVPIIQAPIGSASNPVLAAAVSNAGGLGTLSVTWRDPDLLRVLLRETRALTSRPFGVNLVIEWPMQERLQICLEEGVRVVSFFWGDPAPYIDAVHDANAIVLHIVGSAQEAMHAARAGADAIVAQGWEAGGHVRGTVSTLALVPRVVDAVAPVPVIAAGGIADGRGVAAALALGAQGVWLGTRFVATREAAVHPVYHQQLLQATEDDTVHTLLFDGGWPNAAHRVVRNRTVAAWEQAGSPAAGLRPGEGDVVAVHPDGRSVYRYEDLPPIRGIIGEAAALPVYAGQGVGLVKSVESAADVVRTLVEEAQAVAQRTASLCTDTTANTSR